MRLFLLGLRHQEPGSAAGQLPSLSITSASSFLGQACSHFHRGRQKASEPGNHSAQRCLWGTVTGQPGPQNPKHLPNAECQRQVCCCPTRPTDEPTPNPSSARHSPPNYLWLMLQHTPQKYLPKERKWFTFQKKKIDL